MPPCTWMAVSHTVRAARAQYALATDRRRQRVVGRPSASTAQAACRVALRAPSASTKRVGQQVLDGLEGADGRAVLVALRWRRRWPDRTAPTMTADQVGTGQREAEGRPPRQALRGERPVPAGYRRRRGRRVHPGRRAGQVGTGPTRRQGHLGQLVAVGTGDEQEGPRRPLHVDGHARWDRTVDGDGHRPEIRR